MAFDADEAEGGAQDLAARYAGALPIFYASRKNAFLAWAAKINTNESGKMPAYANAFPEMNHNEMQSFDAAAPDAVAALARLVLLRDPEDDARVKERMDVFRDLMRERGRTVIEVSVGRGSRAEMLARGWYLSHRAAVAAANARGVDPEAVDMVEAFKKRL